MDPLGKVIVVGLDGFDPKVAERLLEAGELPALARLRKRGGYARLATTCPAQTPVAWSTFATGTNPGGHGIFDFLGRDPNTYLPKLALNCYEQKNAFLPPRAINLRRGIPLWELLSAAGISSTVLRCPCTYPPDNLRGRMLAGMGVPDLRGSLGTATFYTSDNTVTARESESVVLVRPDGATILTQLLGPRNPKTGAHITTPITLHLDQANSRAVLESEGQSASLELQPMRWSDWLKVRFKTGLFQSVRGMVRFLLLQTAPIIEFYASPINFDPVAPPFPISAPPNYAGELAAQLGTFYTSGMVEDTGGLNNGRFDETVFLDQCEQVLRERERMMWYELERFQQGFLFCLFDTPDRLQHMFWRSDPLSLADCRFPIKGQSVIARHYRACDEIVGRALQCVDDQTLFIVLSDHGFGDLRRGINLNTWLHDNGLLALKGAQPGEEAGDFLRQVDWERTKAYALGLSGVYINLQGREGQGTVTADEAPALKAALVKALTGLRDPDHDAVAVQSAQTREQTYSGPYVADAPDVLINCAAGYRLSWRTARGGVPRCLVEDNLKKWSGDHIIEPSLVPGVLFMNRAFDGRRARMVDLAPTILASLGLPKGPAMEGEPVL
jgi:predicted AlkP superfamily phosphohydrolase/phosphomutase